MEALESILLILLVADAIGLTVLVLLQQGKGADVGAAFGSGSANTVFGSAGAGSFMTKLTVWLAIGIFLIAFGLAYTAKQKASQVIIEGLPVIPAQIESKLDDKPAETELTPKSEGVDSGLPDV